MQCQPLDPAAVTFNYRATRGRDGAPRLTFSVTYPAHPEAQELIREAVGNLLAPLRGPRPVDEALVPPAAPAAAPGASDGR